MIDEAQVGHAVPLDQPDSEAENGILSGLIHTQNVPIITFERPEVCCTYDPNSGACEYH